MAFFDVHILGNDRPITRGGIFLLVAVVGSSKILGEKLMEMSLSASSLS
jgi:hypothetical protein